MTGAPDKTLLELRRGAIVVAVLASLEREHYGYSLRERLAEAGLEVAEGTLYPLLRRLEAEGLLESRWEVGEARPRRYYRQSRKGRKTLALLAEEWRSLVAVVDGLLEGSEDES